MRFSTSAQAAHTYTQGYSPRAIAKQFRAAQGDPNYRGVFPSGFSPSMVRTGRVCNVILSSYSAQPTPVLQARFGRAMLLLRRACH